MPRFYFIRHGEKISNIGDPALTELGVRHAQETAEYLQQFPITKLFTSPLLRTQQTMEPIAQKLILTPTIDPLLLERTNWGDDPALSFEEFTKEWGRCCADRDLKPSAGDSSREAGRRIERFVQAHATNNTDHIVCTSHGGVIVDFLRNVVPEDVLQPVLYNLKVIHDYVIKECSITIVDVVNGKYVLHVLASTAHLS